MKVKHLGLAQSLISLLLLLCCYYYYPQGVKASMLIPCQVPRAVFAILWGDGKDARYGGEKFPEPELKALTEWLSTSPEQRAAETPPFSCGPGPQSPSPAGPGEQTDTSPASPCPAKSREPESVRGWSTRPLTSLPAQIQGRAQLLGSGSPGPQ